MKKLILLILMVLLFAIISINAFAVDYSADYTVAEQDDLSDENVDVRGASFTNYGTFRADYFSASNATCLNSGSFTVNFGFAITNNTVFNNEGTLRINSVSMLTINNGANFNNNGLVYLSNIEDCDLNGTITGNGDFLYDETVSSTAVEKLKAAVGIDKVKPYGNTEVEQNGASENNGNAGTAENGANGGSHNVTAEYQPGATGSPVYSVDITWGTLQFTYTDSPKGTWNPNTHQYDKAEEAKWSCASGDNVITITNHSNVSVTATASYTPASGYETIKMIFNNNTITLATADNGTNGAAGEPTSGTITVMPEGKLQQNNNILVIGTITISIS